MMGKKRKKSGRLEKQMKLRKTGNGRFDIGQLSAAGMLLLAGMLISLMFPVQTVFAEEVPLGPLIQTTTPKEEYLGLVHLDLLQTDENKTGEIALSVQNVLPSIVRIQTGNFTGSGIILEVQEDTLLIASNRHQLISREFSGIQLFNGEVVSGRRIYLSQQYDVGFVLADISSLSYESRSELRCVRIKEACEKSLTRGTKMFLIGSADGVACNIYQGTVADPWYYFDEFGSYMIYNYCMAKAGMSGGGTYDEHGHCIGMITGGYEDETASLPMELIREEWKKLALP